MDNLRRLAIALVVFAVPLPASAQLDAPTGQYKGTLVHERTLILKRTDPPRVVSAKHKTKVLGFGYVPLGSTRTFIRLILPPGAHGDVGLDRQMTVDFNQDPPVFQVIDGQTVTPVGFPTITVDGNTVTVSSFNGGNTDDYELDEINTLSLKRKP